MDWDSGEPVDDTRYQNWVFGKTMHQYREAALLRHSEAGDFDWVRYWEGSDYGPAGTWPDVLYYPFYFYEFDGQGYEATSPTLGWGDITVIVLWWDDDWPGGTQDLGVLDTTEISLLNNTYPAESYIDVGSFHVSYRVLDDDLPPPTPRSLYNGGKVHIPVGGTLWVEEYRSVRSYGVDPYYGYTTNLREDEGASVTSYLYNLTDNLYTGRSYFRLTDEPHFYLHDRDYLNVDPTMMNPQDNPHTTGGVCIVGATMTVPDHVPGEGEWVEISYTVLPDETILAPVEEGGMGFMMASETGSLDMDTLILPEWFLAAAQTTVYPVMLEIWDPSDPHYRKKWPHGAQLQGSDVWYEGLLDRYTNIEDPEPVEYNARRCQASAVFGRITVRALNRGWNYAPLEEVVGPWTYNMPGLAIWLNPQEITTETERALVQAGENETVVVAVNAFTPTSLTLQIDKAFRPIPPARIPEDLPYTAARLLHPVGGSYTTSSLGFPVVVYETGSRVSGVSDTNLGDRTIHLRARNASGTVLSTDYEIEVVRDASITAYYTAWEANPYFSDDFVTSRITVTSGTAQVGLYLDTTFLVKVKVEGFGRVHRLRFSADDHLNSGTIPGPNQQYIRYYSKRWYPAPQPLNASGQPLTINSTARLLALAGSGNPPPGDRNRSYYNSAAANGNYSIPGLNEYMGRHIDGYTTTPLLNQDLPLHPPDARNTDDTGDPRSNYYDDQDRLVYRDDDPSWMDIYYVEPSGSTIGVDPNMINLMSADSWDDLRPYFPTTSIRVRRR